MKFFTDFLPLIIFFIFYKFGGIYLATSSFLIASIIQMTIHWFRFRHFDTMHIVTFLSGMILGGATLLFHNELFIKWKPTVIYWLLAVVFFVSEFITGKNLLQKLMNAQIRLQNSVWKKLNLMWIVFFGVLGTLNIVVAYHFDTNIWVNFKLFGLLGLTLLFILIQGFYLKDKIIDSEESEESKLA